MPDDARERLRRAQHPGHRRQAHPADPQRDEHRRGRRRSATGPPTSSTCCSTPTPGAAYLAERARRRPTRCVGRARATSGSRRSATCWPRSRRPSCSASAPTTRSSPWPPTARRCTRSERAKTIARALRRRRSATSTPPRCSAEHLAAVDTDHMLECTERDRNRIFNLGYYTWVEQQGTPFEVFEARRSQAFWHGLRRFAAGVGRADRRVQRPRRAWLSAAVVTGWRCAVCGAHGADRHAVAVALPQRPRAEDRAPRAAARRRPARPLRPPDDPNPFVALPARGWRGHAFAAANGMTVDAAAALVRDARRRASPRVDGTGFRVTPFARADALSRRARLRRRRRRVGQGRDRPTSAAATRPATCSRILLHLLAAERLGLAPCGRERPPLAIASCGNAALAAATLAAAVGWPLDVFVPPAADPSVLARLDALGRRRSSSCPRRADDPPGDPCVHRFREAVDAGAVPFSVQGPENALCLDGGRTIGWEMAERPRPLRSTGFRAGRRRSARHVRRRRAAADAGVHPRLHAVQTEGCAPLARAWARRRARSGCGEAPQPLGRVHVAVGGRAAARRPTASSTTRPTTGSASSRRWPPATARRSWSPRPRSPRPTTLACRATGLAGQPHRDRRARRPPRPARPRSATTSASPSSSAAAPRHLTRTARRADRPGGRARRCGPANGGAGGSLALMSDLVVPSIRASRPAAPTTGSTSSTGCCGTASSCSAPTSTTTSPT